MICPPRLLERGDGLVADAVYFGIIRDTRTSALAGQLTRNGIRETATRILSLHRADRLLIVIDQFEELLDEDRFSRADVADFAAVFRDRRAPDAVAVLATLRADACFTGSLTIVCTDLVASWVPADCPDQPTAR